MSLKQEIDESMKDIKTDGYSISVGEIANNYKDGDITIFPEYQRYFRWDIRQKSDLIESLILGIPIPPIFVSQDASAKWDIIDGLQRVCTILEFMGVLKKRDSEETYTPSKLIGTKFLPSLEGKKWDDTADKDNSLDEDVRRIIKRRKLNISIIDSTTNNEVKYELFQRLNTTGSELKPQEVRNCLMVMINPKLYREIIKLAENEDFSRITNLSSKQLQEQYDKELVTRLIVLEKINLQNISSQSDIAPLITECIVEILEVVGKNAVEEDKKYLFIDERPFSIVEFAEKFKETSSLINSVFSENAFRKYDCEKDRYSGPFSLSLFEVIFKHTMDNLQYYKNDHEELRARTQRIIERPDYIEATKQGTRAVDRMKKMFEIGVKVLSENED